MYFLMFLCLCCLKVYRCGLIVIYLSFSSVFCNNVYMISKAHCPYSPVEIIQSINIVQCHTVLFYCLQMDPSYCAAVNCHACLVMSCSTCSHKRASHNH